MTEKKIKPAKFWALTRELANGTHEIVDVYPNRFEAVDYAVLDYGDRELNNELEEFIDPLFPAIHEQTFQLRLKHSVLRRRVWSQLKTEGMGVSQVTVGDSDLDQVKRLQKELSKTKSMLEDANTETIDANKDVLVEGNRNRNARKVLQKALDNYGDPFEIHVTQVQKASQDLVSQVNWAQRVLSGDPRPPCFVCHRPVDLEQECEALDHQFHKQCLGERLGIEQGD